MSMTSPATVAAQIVSDLGTASAGVAAQTAMWTSILTRIQAMISAGTVSVSTTDTITTLQLATTVCATAGSPLTGTISTTGSGTGSLT